MYKNRIEIFELNKIYDEIYYSNFDNGDYGLDVITTLISEKEYEESKLSIRNLEDIIEILIELYDELLDILENEDLKDISTFIRDKKDKISNRELDDTLLEDYEKYIGDYDDKFEENYEDEEFEEGLIGDLHPVDDEEFESDDYDDEYL